MDYACLTNTGKVVSSMVRAVAPLAPSGGYRSGAWIGCCAAWIPTGPSRRAATRPSRLKVKSQGSVSRWNTRSWGRSPFVALLSDLDLVVDEGHPRPELVLELEHDVGDRTADP